ncbi:hypothetical protein [Reyranella sp.]|uniref:hypothetical protein n=1 Tax=Reyranella sp. TaxID=1929291 RepID=UPI003782FA90
MSDVQALHFDDDGETPNNPRLPLLLYRAAVKVAVDHAAVVANIARVPIPDCDPVHGPDGPLTELWSK